MYSSYSKKYTGEIDETSVLFLYPKGGSRWRSMMAFALRRQLSDSSRKRNGGVNNKKKESEISGSRFDCIFPVVWRFAGMGCRGAGCRMGNKDTERRKK